MSYNFALKWLIIIIILYQLPHMIINLKVVYQLPALQHVHDDYRAAGTTVSHFKAKFDHS